MAKGHFKWKNRTDTITYNSWRAMRNRCLFDGNNTRHHKDKGITICSDWVDNYDKFYEDMGERPEGTTLDRIDSDGHYELANCRWSNHREQQNNKYSLSKIEYKGTTKTIGEWCFDLDFDQTQTARAYKRHSEYGCKTYEDLFYEGCILSKRVSERVNLCKVCGRTESIKWRKYGGLCNTCYSRAFRWSKKNNLNIEEFSEWENIIWKTSH